ncbi:hypothetical protein EKK58_10125 [Candidatus Dependentiae bacterium]|nr:MAG: hypothetical protein EKK58_10125 [Candidatus Dependentiae bacterium]
MNTLNNQNGSNLQTSVDIIREIIKREMNLEDDRIYIYNQKFNIPNDSGLFVVVEYVNSKIISNTNIPKVDYKGDLIEYQELYTQEQITVQLFSRNIEALQRKEEAVMALYSTYAQQLQEKLSFRVFRNAPIEDLSELEASAILYRFDIPIIMFTWYEKIKAIGYYNSFRVKVRVNDGDPDLVREFEQPLTDPTN